MAWAKDGGRVAVYHLIGIGGSGMSGLARLLLEAGHQVQGSDRKASPRLDTLRQLGARIFVGHAGPNLDGAERVVVSTAIGPNNPELVEARRRGLPVEHRAAVLAQVLAGRRLVAVSGTHGKTTTTAMAAWVLQEAGLEPGFAVGAEVAQLGGSARLGRGPVVAEVDESDGSFLRFHPEVAVVTNVEADHLEHYGSFDRIGAAFRRFVSQVRPGGLVITCGDDPTARALAQEVPRAVTYGVERQGDLWAEEITLEAEGSRFLAVHREEGPLGLVTLGVPGRHNIANALAVIAVARFLELPFEAVVRALATFRGAARRFETVAEVGGVRVIDDYAHHPTEIRATLAAARPPEGRLVVVFQPHRYTRTQRLADVFAQAFRAADLLFLTEIYAADEAPIPGVTGEGLARLIQAHHPGPVIFEAEREDLVERLLEVLQPGDWLLTLGAGDVHTVGRAVAERLAAQEAVQGDGGGVAAPHQTIGSRADR